MTAPALGGTQVIAVFGDFRVIYSPVDIGDTSPWCIVNRLDQVIRCYRQRRSARRAAKRLMDDEARLDRAL